MNISFRQAPGWWPSLVQAVCECGWHGPVRDMNSSQERILITLDKIKHACEGGTAQASMEREMFR